MVLQTRTKQESLYPDSDGEPMGETPRHVRTILDCYEILDYWFRDRADVFVAANMFVYYVQGDRHKHVSPDVFVVRGIPKSRSRSGAAIGSGRKEKVLRLFWKSPPRPRGMRTPRTNSSCIRTCCACPSISCSTLIRKR